MSEIKTNGFGEKWALNIYRKTPWDKKIHLFYIFTLLAFSVLLLFLTIAFCVFMKHLIYQQDITVLLRVAMYSGLFVICFFLSIHLLVRRNFCKIIKKQEKIIADLKNKRVKKE